MRRAQKTFVVCVAILNILHCRALIFFVVTCLCLVNPSRKAAAAMLEVLGQGGLGPPNTGHYAIRNGFPDSLEEGTLGNGATAKVMNIIPFKNEWAAGKLNTDSDHLRYSAWAGVQILDDNGNQVAGASSSTFETWIRVAPEAGEQVGDDVTMFLHAVPTYASSGATWPGEQWFMQGRVGLLSAPLALISQLPGSSDPGALPEAECVEFTAQIGITYPLFFRSSTSATAQTGQQSILDVHFEVSFSATPPPPPELIPEPSTLALAGFGVIALAAYGSRRRKRC
mgnify:CR=1 FL=1